jgi:membrane-bound lytic murein transglycosylase A
VTLTGYFEPELPASPVWSPEFPVPLHGVPPALPDGPWLTRAQIAATGALAGLELAWLADPLDAFLLQVQGSGRLRFADGRVLRLGYAGRNGHPYTSIGKLLVAEGQIAADQVSIPAIRAWAAANPDRVAGLLARNDSYVFFRLQDLAPDQGPIGTAGRPLTAMRSLAVDPALIPLGSVLWLKTDGPAALQCLVVAEDTGAAITGARADLFCGTGDAAGQLAGRLHAPATLTPLRPA